MPAIRFGLKSKLLVIILVAGLIPAVAISVVLYQVQVSSLQRQIKEDHYGAVLSVDTTIFTVVNDMVNIAFIETSELSTLIKKNDHQTIRERLQIIDDLNDPEVGTGRGLGYNILIVADKNGVVLARSESDKRGDILSVADFGIELERALAGETDARKIIYDAEFMRHEGYNYLVEQYGFKLFIGLTVQQPIFSAYGGQVGVLIIITKINNNHAAIGAINALTGAEFTALAPDGEIMASFFADPPAATPEIIAKARQAVLEMAQGEREKRGPESVIHTIERIYLQPSTAMVAAGHLPEKQPYRFHFIAEPDPDGDFVAIRGIAYELTFYDELIGDQIVYLIRIFVISFIFIAIAGIFAANRFTSPILKITAAVKQLAAGNWNQSVDIRTKDELETLATTFNHMVQVFQQNMELNLEISRQQEMDKLKTDFLSTVSHELRTPLTSVLGFAKIVRSRLDEIIFPLINVEDRKVQRAMKQVCGNIEIIISEGQRLTNLINDVLNVAKMEAGEIEWKSDSLVVVEILEQAIMATSSLIEANGTKLIRDMGKDMPPVTGDRDRLIQVVINLLSNATKFSDSGSITCRVREKEGRIIVSVIDNGMGIAEENWEKVFDRFKQVGDTLTDKPKGTGLGLPICKQIIEHHGGEIWVESSELGQGSNFSFSLPIRKEPSMQVANIDNHKFITELEKRFKADPISLSAGRKRILVVCWQRSEIDPFTV